MSYLLKALKKAEEERLKLADSAEPSNQVISPQASLPNWVVLAGGILVVLSMIKLLGGFESSVEEASDFIAADSKVSSTVFVDSSNKNVISQQFVKSSADKVYALQEDEMLIKPEPKVSSSFPVEEALSTKGSRNAQVSTVAGPRQLAELTKDELNQIPSLSLESHLYSSVAKYSSVIINGQAHSEGDLLSHGVVLKHINANGIVISFGDNLVELPKGITWVSTNYAK